MEVAKNSIGGVSLVPFIFVSPSGHTLHNSSAVLKPWHCTGCRPPSDCRVLHVLIHVCVFSSVHFATWRFMSSAQSRCTTVPSRQTPPFCPLRATPPTSSPVPETCQLLLLSPHGISRMWCKWNHILWNILSLAFCHSASFPWDPSRLWRVSTVHSFSLLSHVPWAGYSTALWYL